MSFNPTPKRRAAIYARDEHRCQYCGVYVDDQTATLDHLIPQALGGHHKPSNLVTCCKSCNCSKGSKTLELFRLSLMLRRSQFNQVINAEQYLRLTELGVHFPEISRIEFWMERDE